MKEKLKRFQRKISVGLIAVLLTMAIGPENLIFAEAGGPVKDNVIATSSDAMKGENRKLASSNDANYDEDEDLINDLTGDEELCEDISDKKTSESNMAEDEMMLEGEDNLKEFRFSQIIDGYIVDIFAPAEVFPEDTQVVIEKVDSVDGEPIKELVEEKLDQNEKLSSVISFDITFFSNDIEIQPEEGYVTISIKLADDIASDDEIKVFHIEDKDDIESIAYDSVDNNAVVYRANSFSVYTVAKTTEAGSESNEIYFKRDLIDEIIKDSDMDGRTAWDGEVRPDQIFQGIDEEGVTIGTLEKQLQKYDNHQQEPFMTIGDEKDTDMIIWLKLEDGLYDYLYTIILPYYDDYEEIYNQNGEVVSEEAIRAIKIYPQGIGVSKELAICFADMYTKGTEEQAPFHQGAEKEAKEIFKNYIDKINRNGIYTVTFISDGVIYKTVDVKEGECVEKPDDPISALPDEYVFSGWEYGTKGFDFLTPITENMTLYAKWKENETNEGTTTLPSSGSSSSGSSSSGSSSSGSSSSNSSVTVGNGLKQENGATYYYNQGVKVVNSWADFTYDGVTVRRYFDSTGKMLTGWSQIGEDEYGYFQEKGGMYYGAYVPMDEFLNALNSYSPANSLGSYMDVASFVDNVDFWTGLEYSLSAAENTIKAMWTSLYEREQVRSKGYWETVASEFMNDPDKCRSQLRKLVNQLANTEDEKFLKDSEVKFAGLISEFSQAYIESKYGSKLSEEQKERIRQTFSDTEDLLDLLEDTVSKDEALVKQVKDYNKNLTILESLKASVPEGTQFSKIIDDTIFEYKNAVLTQLFENAGASLGEDNIYDLIDLPKLLDKTMKTKFSTAFSIIDLTAGNLGTVNAIEDIVYGNIIVSGSNYALRDAEGKVKEAVSTGDTNTINTAIQNYVNIFDVAKAAKISEYNKMLDYYNSIAVKSAQDWDQISYLNGKVKELNQITIYN